jgi:transposase
VSIEFIHHPAELEHKLITMHLAGGSIRSISRHFHMGRNRVRAILREHTRGRDEGRPAIVPAEKPVVSRKLTAYKATMVQLLEKYPDITGIRMREQLILAGYDGGITIIREWLRRFKPTPKHAPVVRFETDPGVQGQMDWSPYTIIFTKSGKKIVQCFSYILGFSRRQYIDFTVHHDFYTLIRRHVDTFEYFGGVMLQCLYDNEKTVVLRWEAGRPVFNPAFIDFITHYQCKPIACKPRTPQTKGKIEKPFQYVEGNLLNARTFQDIEDLRACARWWLTEKSDTHLHETTHRPPMELFLAEEKSRLQPLPRHPYDCGEVSLRVCSLDAFLELETNRYSLPYEYVGDILALKATEHEIFIYNPYLELIATHERRPDGAGATCEEPAHRKSKNVRYGLEPVREAFERLGENAKDFLLGLQNKHPHHCGFHARSILLFKEQYNAEDIDSACAWARRYQAYDAGAIKRILLARAKPRTLESIRNEKARVELEKTLPPIKQRNLSEYSDLLRKDTANENQPPADGQSASASQNPETAPDGEGTRPPIVPGG